MVLYYYNKDNDINKKMKKINKKIKDKKINPKLREINISNNKGNMYL